MISSLYRWHWKQIFFDIWLFNIKYKKISFYWRYKVKLLCWETWHRNKITHICFQCLKELTKHLLDCNRKYQSCRGTFLIRSAVKVYTKWGYFYRTVHLRSCVNVFLCFNNVFTTFFWFLTANIQKGEGVWQTDGTHPTGMHSCYHCTFAIASTFFFALIMCSQRFSGSWRKYTKIFVTQFSTTPRVLIKSNRSNGNSCWIYRRALC